MSSLLTLLLTMLLLTPEGGNVVSNPGEARSPSQPALRRVNVGATRITGPKGPCTEAARRSMPQGRRHNHQDIRQHRFACRMRQVFFDGLRGELAAERDVVLGEMDVKRGIAAVAVTFPESGVLFFDVSNPARPKFLSWYRGSKCESVVIDNNCGAFVDLSRDGKVAFLSVQSLTVVPGRAADEGVRPVSAPGVEVIDVSDRRNPRLSHLYPVVSEGGVHTSRSHVIPAGPAGTGPRVPGEYLFSVANGIGVEITRVDRDPRPVLMPVNRIPIDDVHDMFVQNDRLTRRTYLYVAAGLESGFYVYDVTDPSEAELLAEWDLTPDCSEDWYAHTIDVAVRNGRRYVTMDAETFNLGEQVEDEQARCGRVFGNADKPGPLWIVDATDFAKLGPASDFGGDVEVDTLKRRSAAALVATWTNPAGRRGGNLQFSPHNQQIVGNKIYLSHYHGGVYVLDARRAFRGQKVRPRELGFIVPHGRTTRPFVRVSPEPVLRHVGDMPRSRPMIWDAFFYRGYVLAADMFGGLYALQYDGDR